MINIIEYKNKAALKKIFSRTQIESDEVFSSVREIIASVRKEGDKALFEYTKKFDNFSLNSTNLKFSNSEIESYINKAPKAAVAALENAKKNIEQFHIRQLPKSRPSGKTGFIFRPVDSVGIYVPGGKAAYPLTVLMCAIPAVVTGVKRIVMVTPPTEFLHPLNIVAAKMCGITEIYRVGGAQSIAALAYGTESIKKVSVISGPGNIFVTAAKKEVFGAVGIDMIAGPSEILILADSSAKPEFVAADMLGQAEHDELAQSILITTDRTIAEETQKELALQLEKLPKKDIAKKSLLDFGAIVLCKTQDEMIELSNEIAPEHLEICLENPQEALEKITNAGAVFLGNFSPEALGDYYAGTNHVLPTSGTAKFSQGLGVDTYLKRISIVNYRKDDLQQVGSDIVLLAELENLQAHAQSVLVRKEIRK